MLQNTENNEKAYLGLEEDLVLVTDGKERVDKNMNSLKNLFFWKKFKI